MSESSPDTQPKSHRRKRARRPLKVAAGISFFLIVAVPAAAIVAWQHDERTHRGRVARATTVAGVNVSAATPDALRTTLTGIEQRVRTESIDIGHDQQRFDTPTADFSLHLDVDKTQQAVLAYKHDETAPKRFVSWVSSHFHDNAAPVVVVFDDAKLANLISTKDPGPRTQPSNPTISWKNGDFQIVSGSDGHGLVNKEAPAAVRNAVKNGFPLHAHIETGNIPAISDANDLQSMVVDAKAVSKDPVNVTAEGKTGTITVDQLRPLLTATPSGDHLRLDLDSAATTKQLQQLLAGAGHKAVEAGFTIVDDTPKITDGSPGTECCGDAAVGVLRDALLARLHNGDPNAVVDLPMKPVSPKTTAAQVPDLGIKEKIGTFTTNYPPGQPRVTNIHLIADLTRGAIVKPGETFSINNYVGERTTEKGFVVDHVIEDGKFAESVGGGISQYATTLFNAAFFGGLDFGEYQSHSIYIDRYPYGREATVSFPHPDMQVKNTTPYGVLIWPTYTSTSLTVSLYSTKYATGEQTGQTTQPSGNCTRVRTERTRTYVDGHTSKDTVGSLYQPKEGEKC